MIWFWKDQSALFTSVFQSSISQLSVLDMGEILCKNKIEERSKGFKQGSLSS